MREADQNPRVATQVEAELTPHPQPHFNSLTCFSRSSKSSSIHPHTTRSVCRLHNPAASSHYSYSDPCAPHSLRRTEPPSSGTTAPRQDSVMEPPRCRQPRRKGGQRWIELDILSAKGRLRHSAELATNHDDHVFRDFHKELSSSVLWCEVSLDIDVINLLLSGDSEHSTKLGSRPDAWNLCSMTPPAHHSTSEMSTRVPIPNGERAVFSIFFMCSPVEMLELPFDKTEMSISDTALSVAATMKSSVSTCMAPVQWKKRSSSNRNGSISTSPPDETCTSAPNPSSTVNRSSHQLDSTPSRQRPVCGLILQNRSQRQAFTTVIAAWNWMFRVPSAPSPAPVQLLMWIEW